MDKLLCIQTFVRVAETGSFTEAARQLGIARSVVTTRVRQLEEHIDAPLFHRSTRHVRLSEFGVSYFKECSELIAHIDGLTDQMRELHSTPTGSLRIQVLPGFALGHLGRALKDFGERYPKLFLDIIVNDRVVDPVEEGYDLSLHIFPPVAESLIERKIFPVRRVFCASPEYLSKRGTPTAPKDLLDHVVGLYSGYPTRNRWTFHRGGRKTELELKGALRSNSVHLLNDFAISGAGIVCIPTIVASPGIVDGRLVPVLRGHQLSSFSLAAIYPPTHRHTVKVKLFVDFVVDRFAGEPAWDKALAKHGLVLE